MTEFNRVTVVSNSRAEDGPLESVIKAMPGCSVTRFISDGMSPAVAIAEAIISFPVSFENQKSKAVSCEPHYPNLVLIIPKTKLLPILPQIAMTPD